MTTTARSTACLTEDELLGLASGTLGDAPAAEAHLATCSTCSALLAAIVRRPARAWDELAGSMLGPYRIDSQIGAGGMGAVYRAWDPRLGRAIAVKVLHAGGERLAVEARAAAAIGHRAIVGIHDVGVADGIHYVAMELVDGESLRSVLARGGLGVARAKELTIELVDGLAAAHARGVIHRDLKPENLVITRGGLRVLDFGLAKVEHSSALDVTEPGTVQGTAGYMAPEQARGEVADERVDLFAAGAIAYEMVTGTRAFPGATNADRLSATLRDTPAVDELGELAPIIARCLAKEPRDRFQSAADLAWTLRSTTPGARTRRLSRRTVLAAGASAAVATALGYLFGRSRGGSRAATVPAVRPLTHKNGRVYTARFTRDGSHVVYGAAWDGDPVQIYEMALASGETFAVDLPSADVLAISPRDELAVSVGHRFVDHQSARGSLAVVPLAGGVPRPLTDDIESADFTPERPDTAEFRHSPAGSLAVVRAHEHGFRVELPIGTTLADEPTWTTHLRVSPDGMHVAYLRHPHTNHDGGALVITNVATKEQRVLTEGWASIAGLVWDPDGNALWFTGSREDLGNTMYRVDLDGTETAIPVPTANRLRLHDLTSDRRALVTIDSWRLRAMVGDHDRSMSEVSYVSDMSADGAQVLIGELGELESGAGAYLVPYAGGRPLRLGPGYPIAISPSGERIAANVREANPIVVYSIRSSESLSIATPGFVTSARWIDERSLVAVFEDKLWRLALDAKPVPLVDTAGSFALDPPRRRCAYLDHDRTLCVLDLASGASRTLPVQLARSEVCGWLAEPDAIIVRTTTTPIVLDRIDPASGARTHHRDIQPPLLGLKAVDNLVLHADGERYAYCYGQELSELVVMSAQG